MPCYSLEGVIPVVHPSAHVHPTAVLIGDVHVGPDCYVGPCASLRGDFGRIVLEEGANLQDTCVVLTGAGRAFCAGQDLADPAISPPDEAARASGAAPKDIGHLLAHFYRPMLLRLRSMPVPVIAAVNGVAAGAGANLALACDLVVAARSASFIQAFSKIGLVPDCGGTWLLPRLVGRAAR